MHLKFRGLNEAFTQLVRGIHNGTIPTTKKPSRVGEVLTIEEPMTITYERPIERVLFNVARDASPAFHLYESMWMIAGRNDLAPLQYYVSTFDAFSDDGKILNGAYGYRWRKSKTKEVEPSNINIGGDPSWNTPDIQRVDQLNVLVEHLKKNPGSRRAVLQMWEVESDLLKIDTSKDVCCNLSVMFSLREVSGLPGDGYQVLDMTVTNRSNDMVWGMLGANVVHFSFLLEYMAARLGVKVGVYNQFTNNLHVYTERWEPGKWLDGYGPNRDMHSPRIFSYEKDVKLVVPLVHDVETFEQELPAFVTYNAGAPQLEFRTHWREPFLDKVAQPLLYAFHFYKQKDFTNALASCDGIIADDWRIVALNWVRKRKEKADARSKEPTVPVEQSGA